jgi:hypothetical protein
MIFWMARGEDKEDHIRIAGVNHTMQLFVKAL